MSTRSGILVAACLTLSFNATGAALAVPEARPDGSRGSAPAVRTPVGDSRVWFPISFELAHGSNADLLKPVDEPVRSEPSSAPAPPQDVQVPATVQNLRRADH